MKKIFMVLAATFICGASVVITSCGGNDDEIQEPKLTPNTYEVTLSAVLPESAAEFFNLELEYTDADGKKSTVTVKAGDQSESMIEEMKSLFNEEKNFQIGLLKLTDEQAKVFDKLIIKNVKFNVPAGKSFSYKATTKVRSDYAQPAEDSFNYLSPFVYLSSKRISGESTDYSVFTEQLKLSVLIEMESAHLDELIEVYGNKVVANVSRTML